MHRETKHLSPRGERVDRLAVKLMWKSINCIPACMLSIYYTANPSAVKSVPLLPILAGQKSLGETMQYITAADLFWSEGEKKCPQKSIRWI